MDINYLQCKSRTELTAVMPQRLLVILVTVLSLPHVIQSQVNPAFTQSPANVNLGSNNVFYLDSNSDCNGPVRELLASTATVRGNDASQTRQGPSTCTVRLQSTGQFDSTVLDIEVKSMNIQDCTTQVSLYDGNGAQHLMMTYDCRTIQNQNRKRFLTSGNTATFIMTRQNINNVNFDIEIMITPTRGGIDPGSENGFGAGYYFDKFPQTAIVGMIGAFYVLILVLCAVIVVYFSRSYWGLNKAWETHQLSTIKTGTVLDGRLQPSDVWSVQAKQTQGPANQYSHGVTDPRPRKNVTSSGVEECVFYNDDAFQKRHLMNDEKDKARPRYISVNTSFTAAEKEPDHREKIGASRVNSRNNRNKLPPSYKDAVCDHMSDHSSDEESEITGSVISVKKMPVSSDEERSQGSRSSKSDSSSKSGSSSGTKSDEESNTEVDQSNEGNGAREKRHEKAPHRARLRDSEDLTSSSRHNPLHTLHLAPQMQQVPYGVYPSAHFVPVMTGPSQFQPFPVVPAFPPPNYPEKPAAFPLGYQVQPTEPPVYSYLVRRGYTPLEAQSNSPASIVGSERLGDKKLEVPELRLDSGVEYMRR